MKHAGNTCRNVLNYLWHVATCCGITNFTCRIMLLQCFDILNHVATQNHDESFHNMLQHEICRNMVKSHVATHYFCVMLQHVATRDVATCFFSMSQHGGVSTCCNTEIEPCCNMVKSHVATWRCLIVSQHVKIVVLQHAFKACRNTDAVQHVATWCNYEDEKNLLGTNLFSCREKFSKIGM